MGNYLIAAATFLATAVTVSVPAMAIEQGHPGGAPVTRAEMQARVQTRFAAVDANKDGVVTKAELDAYAAKARAEHAAKRGERRNERFAGLDANRDGQISREEFAAADADRDGKRGPDGKGHGKHGERGGHRMGGPGFGGHGMAGRGGGRGGEELFAAMDTNKDGRVTLAEASAKPLAMFDAADANKDGTVTPEERRAARIDARAAWAARRG